MTFLQRFFLCLILIAPLAAFAGKKTPKAPGTIQLNDSVSIDATEISVNNWNEYQYWLKETHGEKSELFKASAPNKTVWKDTLGLSLRKLYFDHPAYLKHPMVGITMEQAEAYCQWRTDRVNEYIFYKITKNKPHPDSIYTIPQYYIFKLPTIQQYETAANFGNKKSVDKKIKKGKIMPGNFAESRNKLMEEAITYTTSVWRFTPNKKKIYNLYGNIAEMTSTKGKAFGGSFRTSYTAVSPQYLEDYTYIANALGFRCVAIKQVLPESEVEVEK
jgi:formylglycine-generating enzyme required for sulfatase activity